MHAFLITKGTKENRILKIKELIGFDYLAPDFDVLFLDVLEGKKLISIDQVKYAVKESVYKPIKKQYKYIVMHNANLLTIEAQNALLKSLEEPYDHIKFYLETDHEQKILDTITSRCSKIYCSSSMKESLNSVDSHILDANEFIALEIGKRLDLLQKTKTKFDTKDSVLEFINALTISLHANFKSFTNDLNHLRHVRYRIKLLTEYKKNIHRYNVNLFLALENLAINL